MEGDLPGFLPLAAAKLDADVENAATAMLDGWVAARRELEAIHRL